MSIGSVGSELPEMSKLLVGDIRVLLEGGGK
jgi:hypothetical protein